MIDPPGDGNQLVSGFQEEPEEVALSSSADPLPSIEKALNCIDDLAFQMGGSPLDGQHHPHVGAIQDWTRIVREHLAAADPALRTLSQQWRDRAVATDAFAMEPQHSEQARSNLQHLAAQMELCAADLDRLCPEIRDEPKSDPV